jgi:hypothetical protein
MSGIYADGVYGHKPWNKLPDGSEAVPPEAAYPPQQYIGPFASNQDRLINQALASWTMDGADLQEYVRPPLPQINLFPARFGYSENEIGIEDIIDLPRSAAPTAQRVESDFSQTPNTTESTSRNTLGYGV